MKATKGFSVKLPGVRIATFYLLMAALMSTSSPLFGQTGVSPGAKPSGFGNPHLCAAIDGKNCAANAKLAPSYSFPRLASNYGNLPLSFEANRGQAASQVRFLARGQGYSLYLTPSAAVLALSSRNPGHQRRGSAHGHGGSRAPDAAKTDAIRMDLAGSSRSAAVAGEARLPGTANYFIGNDPAKWHSSVPTYARVRYSGLYPGVDLVYYGNQGHLEYDFIVAPGADPASLRLRFTGQERLALGADGNLTISAKNGEIAFQKPIVYQAGGKQSGSAEQADGRAEARVAVEGKFVLLADHTVGFKLGSYDHGRALVIDPELAYSTYLGGSASDAGNGIAVDSQSHAYVTGETASLDFPTTAKAFHLANLSGSTGTAFVAKLSQDGSSLIYSTYLGGSGGDAGIGIAVGSGGNAYITGNTGSSDFPTTNGAFQTAIPGDSSPFVSELNPAGTALVYSTYLGGSSGDSANGIAIDGSGHAYVAGTANSLDFPVTPGAFQTVNYGAENYESDGFIAKLNPSGTALVYSTFLGSGGQDYSQGDEVSGIAVDTAGDAYLTGETTDGFLDFPLTSGAISTCYARYENAFVTKLNPAGSALVYSTCLGGGYYNYGTAIALDASGDAYVTGVSYEDDGSFPTTPGSYMPNSPNGGQFVAKLDPAGSGLLYSTYFPAGVSAVAVDGSGDAYLTGGAGSGFPATSDAYQAENNSAGGSNAYLAKLDKTGSALLYASYLGGTGSDSANAIALDASGDAYLTGTTSSSDFPLSTNAYQKTNDAAHGTAFVAKFSFGAGGVATLAPVFSLPSGVYAASQTVSISYASPEAAIYYTTNGKIPTSASTLYAGPIAVTSSERLTAIAFATAGGAPSAVATAAYTIATSTPADAFNFSEGFAEAQKSIQLNGDADLNGSRLQLTSGHLGEAPGSAFYATPVNIQSFSTDFTFQLTNPNADGLTFAIQNHGVKALGVAGEGLGYEGIGRSAAIKFDLHNNAGEGPNSTGLFTDGAAPTVPAINLTGTGIDLHSGDSILAQIAYDGTTLVLTLTDTATLAMWSRSFAIDIPATVGGNTAYLGFTGATGGLTADQEILSWTYISGKPGPAVPPLIAPALPAYAGGLNAVGLTTNGSASISGTTLQLTNGQGGDGSAFYAVPLNVASFATDFTFLLASPSPSIPLSDIADGITFTIQGVGPTALGSGGGGLGYTNLGDSVAVKFDLYNNSGEGPNSTGVYAEGQMPTTPSIDLTGTGIDLHSGHPIAAHIAYSGTKLNLALTDTVTVATWSQSYPDALEIPAIVLGNTAYVGFTGATGGRIARQQILKWTFTSP